MIVLTPKQIRVYIAAKKTPEDLCDKYHCTIDELKEAFRQRYKHNPKDGKMRWKELEKNRSKLKTRNDVVDEYPKGHKPTVVTNIPTSSAEPESIPEEAVIREQTPEASASEPIVAEVPMPEPSVAESNTSESLILELKEEEEHVIIEITELEKEREQLIADNRGRDKALKAIGGKLGQVNTELEQTEQKLALIKSEVSELVMQSEELLLQKANADEARKDVNQRKRQKVERLTEIRDRIDALSTIVLYVYSDGRIEAPENPDFVLNDEGYQELKAELGEKEECIDLRVRDVITLARLLKIVSHSDGRTIEIAFDQSELEAAYEAVR